MTETENGSTHSIIFAAPCNVVFKNYNRQELQHLK